jgi:uncharacterized protein YcaQ
MIQTLSIGQARRIALAAQGLAKPERTGRANWTRIARTVEQMNLLQIDSVNVLVRSHYLPVFSRIGQYSQAVLDERSFGDKQRALFECWAHEASLLPLALHPLIRWRQERAKRGNGTYKDMAAFGREFKAYVSGVLDFVRKNGPTAVRDLPDPGEKTGKWWGWSKGKFALEYLFDTGALTTATRRGFERIYDVPGRVIPSHTLNAPTPPEADAIRQLVDLSARAHGVATETDLRDYFRLPVAETKRAIGELIEDGRLVLTAVEGWKAQAYLHRDAKIPKTAQGAALLSPFDPLVWERARAERLFDFHYRIEIYTPSHKRKFGYYVLPFILGDRIAARVCLKADRQAGILRANAAHKEQHANMGETAVALARELQLMANWLGLERIEIGPAGDLSRSLKDAI